MTAQIHNVNMKSRVKSALVPVANETISNVGQRMFILYMYVTYTYV